MTIIAVVNSKGGVGKSTTAVHLAAWLHEQGHSVILADCDTQQSSSEWIREACPGVRAVRLDNPNQILNELPSLAQDCDYVVADGPGSQTDTSRALLLRAHMAIVPCKASMLESEGTSQSNGSIDASTRHSRWHTEGSNRPFDGWSKVPANSRHERRCRNVEAADGKDSIDTSTNIC